MLTSSAIHVAVTVLKSSDRTLPASLSRRLKRILELNLEMWTNHELCIKSVGLVLNHYYFGAKRLCHLPFLWCGVSLKNTAMSATFVHVICKDIIVETNRTSHIRICPLQDDMCLMDLIYLFPFLLHFLREFLRRRR